MIPEEAKEPPSANDVNEEYYDEVDNQDEINEEEEDEDEKEFEKLEFLKSSIK